MKISKEEIMHIAELADLKIEENEIDKYILNLQDILNYANIVNNAPIEGLDVTVGTLDAVNVFREDKVVEFDNVEGLLQNTKERESNMFKIPKVIM